MTPTEKLIAEARELANAIENCIGGDNCDGCKLKSYMLCEVDRKTADSLIALCDALEQAQATLEQTWEWDMYKCAQQEIDRLRKGLEQAQNDQRWTETEYSPPDDIGQSVWLYSQDGEIVHGEYLGEGWYNLPRGAVHGTYFSHWMPDAKPQPPKGED